jgi:hypothetical protein
MSISSVNGMGMNPYVDFNATENYIKRGNFHLGK